MQRLYVEIFGGRDVAPIEPSHFVLPEGHFVVAYEGEVPIAMGGWRRRNDTDAEIKRMYVRDGYRGRGAARTVLAGLEESARAQGIDRLILETTSLQIEALSLYRSHGYDDVPAFGYYADSGHSVHLGKRL